MKRISLIFLMAMCLVSASASSNYKVDCWYDVSQYFTNLKVRYYITQKEDDNIVHFLVESSFAYIQFQLDGLIADDFIYMAHESNCLVRDQVRFMNDYIGYMISKRENFPDNALYTDKNGRMVSYRKNSETAAQWKEGYRQYMVEKGWYKAEKRAATGSKVQNDDNLIDPLADLDNITIMTDTAELAQQQRSEKHTAASSTVASSSNNVRKDVGNSSSTSRTLGSVGNTSRHIASNNPANTSSRAAGTTSSGSTSSSAANDEKSNSSEGSGAGWLIGVAVLYFLFKGNKKSSKTHQSNSNKTREMYEYDEWQKQSQSGWH